MVFRLLLCAVCLGSFALPVAHAEQAQLLLYPTRIILENNVRAATLNLKNTGNATGAYRIEVIDMHMYEDGSIKQVPEGQIEPFSAKNMLRIAPRSVTLEAGQDQNIRIMVKRPEGLTEGEYRAHLKVTLMNDQVNSAEEAKSNSNASMGIMVKPKLSMVIPVITRFGKPSVTAAITNPHIQWVADETGKKQPYLHITLERQGNRSTMGDIEVAYKTPEGKNVIVKNLAGVPVYNPTPKRLVIMPLDVPEGISITKGAFYITYRTQEKEGGTIIAEKEYVLP